MPVENDFGSFSVCFFLEPASCWSGCKKCFGSLESQCQQSKTENLTFYGCCFAKKKLPIYLVYRDNCADQCPNQMRYNSSSLVSKFCCHAECAAGCFGPTDKECYVNFLINFLCILCINHASVHKKRHHGLCKNRSLLPTDLQSLFQLPVWLKGCDKLQNGKKCVDKCPPPEIYNPQTMQMQQIPDGKYAYKRLCVDHCPAHTVTYRGGCLSRYPKGFFINDAHICQECDGSCPKSKSTFN